MSFIYCHPNHVICQLESFFQQGTSRPSAEWRHWKRAISEYGSLSGWLSLLWVMLWQWVSLVVWCSCYQLFCSSTAVSEPTFNKYCRYSIRRQTVTNPIKSLTTISFVNVKSDQPIPNAMTFCKNTHRLEQYNI